MCICTNRWEYIQEMPKVETKANSRLSNPAYHVRQPSSIHLDVSARERLTSTSSDRRSPADVAGDTLPQTAHQERDPTLSTVAGAPSWLVRHHIPLHTPRERRCATLPVDMLLVTPWCRCPRRGGQSAKDLSGQDVWPSQAWYLSDRRHLWLGSRLGVGHSKDSIHRSPVGETLTDRKKISGFP